MSLRAEQLTLGVLLTCALLSGPAAAQTCVEPPLGLRGWWPGDGDSIDLQSGLHGVAVDGASYGPGLVGQAFAFDGLAGGQDDRVDLPPGALDGLSDLSIEMWVQSEAEQGAILSGAAPEVEGEYTDNEVLLMQGIDGTFVFLRQVHTGALPVFLNDGDWHHLAFTRSGDVGTLYVDGVVIDSSVVSAEPLEIGPGGLMLGQEQDCLGGCFDPGQAFDGLLDEIAIYDRALSEAEVVAIFEAREAGKCKPLSNEDLLDEIDGLESEMQTLLDRIAELEGAAEEEIHPRWDHGNAWKHSGRRDWGHSRR